jgi:hypothetical protein
MKATATAQSTPVASQIQPAVKASDRAHRRARIDPAPIAAKQAPSVT